MIIDALVIGGGPAGAATALALAARGAGVTLLERRSTPVWKIGETLSPNASFALRTLGIEKQFAQEEHLRSYGVCSAWGTQELAEQDFICHPSGCGWQLDRPRFEQFLLRMAADAGVKVLCGVTAQSATQARGTWNIGASRATIACRWVVDATGRRSFLGRHLAKGSHSCGRLVSVYAVAQAEGRQDQDTRTWVESASDGWWYSALGPNGRRTVAWQTDSKLIHDHFQQSRSWFREKLRATHHLERLLTRYNYQFVEPPRATSAGSFRLRSFCGENWIAVGDAAMSFDPLSGYGLCKALESAHIVANKIVNGETREAGFYEDWCEKQWLRFLEEHRRWYAMERRWLSEPFWSGCTPKSGRTDIDGKA